jgi:alpha/beta hydrolase family protein
MKRAFLVAAFTMICVVAVGAQTMPVPNPTVIGPIPATAAPGDPSHKYPFFATVQDLPAVGYIEEEFFFEGTANRYNTPTLKTGSIIDGGHTYKTRMIVRRPLSPEAFNGVVLMEWQNDAGSYTSDIVWAHSHEHWLRRGYAWIGVTAFRLGVHDPTAGLKAWNPARYGTLDVTDGGTILNDALSYDIISQAAQAVRHPMGVDPMGGLPVKLIFVIGLSKSANSMVPYHNSIQPLHGVFDGFGIFMTGTKLRTDLGVKVFKVITETDVANQQAWQRQPNSDHFRRWEVAGASHVDYHYALENGPVILRDIGPWTLLEGCAFEPNSRIPAYYVFNAAIDHLVKWVKHDVQPPVAPDIETSSVGPPATVVRDSFGNALGGIQLAQHAVPTALNMGTNTPELCRPYGSYQPFDDATLALLYPDHQTYLERVIAATHENLKQGYIVGRDAAATISDAARSDIGRQ